MQSGISLANEGKYEQALDILRKVVGKSPDSANAQLALGMVALQAKNYDEALGSLEKAVELEPDSPSANYGLAMIYEHKGRVGDACNIWKQFIGLVEDQNLKDMADRHLRCLEE